MSHGIETHNGQAAVATARKPAWHRLGQVVEDYMSAEDVLKESRLAGWNLRKTPLLASDEDSGEMVDVPNRYAVVRDNPLDLGSVDALGVVGPMYSIMQNESLTGLLDALVDESGAHYDSAGSIDGGRKVFVSMKLPDHINVGGVDPVDTYLAAMTSHDGTMSTNIITTPVRVVCQNTMNLALGTARSAYRVRHTTGANTELLAQARTALEVSFQYLEGFQDMAEQLINTTMTQMRFEELVEENFSPEPDASDAAHTRADNRAAEMARLFSDSNTHEDVRDTAWAGLNALTEYYDYYAPVRSTSAEEDEVRARKSILDTGFKDRALKMIQRAC